MKVKNIVVISDTHCGCQLGLCPPHRIHLDGGGFYEPSPMQKKMWAYWEDFWNNWVPDETEGEPFAVVFNGDLIDGVHHRTTTQISHNLSIQKNIALEIMQPIVKRCAGKKGVGKLFYLVRGTEAHVGQSAETEEMIAEELGAIPDAFGNYSRFELLIEFGDALIHFLHHIGTTTSSAYEGTALSKEYVESCAACAIDNVRPPNILVRSHRHRSFGIDKTRGNLKNEVIITPGWQLKTPYTFRKAGARVSQPEMGGYLIRQGKKRIYTMPKTYVIERPEAIKL